MRKITAQRIGRLSLLTLVALLGCATAQATEPNSGLPGSRCEPLTIDVDTDPLPDALVSNTALDEFNPPHYYELALPDSRTVNPEQPPRLFMFIHGGRWFLDGSLPVVRLRVGYNLIRARGWQVMAIGYRGCENSLGDVVRFYDIMRERLGPEAVICAQGEGSGGHLALMLAAMRPDVACVLAEAAPTDLTSIGGQPTFVDPRLPVPAAGLTGAQYTQNLVSAAFGEERLAELSPINHAATYADAGTRMSILMSENDTLIPTAQVSDFAAAVRALNPEIYLSTQLIPGENESGGLLFVSGFIARDSATDLFTELAELLAPLEQ